MPFGAIGLCRAVGLEWPALLRELNQPPATVRCQRPIGRPISVQQYRERRVITDLGRPFGPESADRDLERRCRQWITRPALGLLRNDSAPSGWASRRDPHGWGLGPGHDGTIIPRQAVALSGEEENKRIRAVAGGPLRR
jgi:hypothetical protein